jgi:hypothetical protein
MTKQFNNKLESNHQSQFSLSMDIQKLDNKLRKELIQTGRVDNVQAEIFAWIDTLTAAELSACRMLIVSLINGGKILDNSLLKDIIKYSKPKYKPNTDY